jgi:uncharacterized protein YjbJ (UPF0337 family)
LASGDIVVGRQPLPNFMPFTRADGMTTRSGDTRNRLHPGPLGIPIVSAGHRSSMAGRPQGGSKMDKDLDQAKGRIKQAAGDLTNNDKLKKEGKLDEGAGKAKEFLEDAKDKGDDAIDSMTNRARQD